MTDKPRSVMIIGAHPDDPDFGCAGTTAKWLAEGCEVRYVLCTSGDKGSWDPAVTPGEMATIREREQMDAAAELGVAECIFLRHVDGEVEATMAFRRELAMLIRQFKPDVVVTHDPWLHYQIHPDHRAVGITVTDAIAGARDVWYYPDQFVGGIGAHRVKDLYYMRAQEPNCWIDISETFDRKIAALSKHVSQVSRIPDLAERMRQRAEATGREKGLRLAEAFHRLELA
ncbi:MAG: PIG-L deacetylase family protein [Chloroflexota bacterium]